MDTKSLPRQPERAAGDFAMIEPCRAIELLHDRRQLGARAPLIRTAAGRLERRLPPLPPRCGAAGKRFDDQHAAAAAAACEETLHQRLARRVRELVERER